LNINWYKWRPIIEKIVTLEELERYWDINDLADAHEALNIRSDAEEFFTKESLKRAKRK